MRPARGFLAIVALLLSLVTTTAAAEVELVDSKGWRFSTDGRVNGFLSFTLGDGYPLAPLDSAGVTKYTYVPGSGLFGEPGITDDKNRITSTRIRSGYAGSILAFRVKKDLAPATKLDGYFSLWTGIQTQQVRFSPVQPDVRESYLRVQAPWGTALVGRTLGLFGKMSVDIDDYAHAYALGYPCQLDKTMLATCGQVGFGVIDPYFSAGGVYTTPRLAGFALAAGLYDPVTFASKWALTPLPRLEGELSYELPLGSNGKLRAAVEGLWQRLGQVETAVTTDAFGVAGGARLEIGPVRLGLATHYGAGLGFFYALEDTPASLYTAVTNDPPGVDATLRTYAGYYGQTMVVLGRLDVAAGAGVTHLNRLEGLDVDRPDKGPPNIALPRDNLGINGVVAYHLDENLVASIDFFRAVFSWYDGATQGVNTLNTGMTMAW